MQKKERQIPNIPSLNSKAARRTIRSLIKCAGLVAAADLLPEVFFTVTFYFHNQWNLIWVEFIREVFIFADYFNAFLEFRAQENPLNINGWNVDIFGWNGTVLNNFFNFGDCYFGCLAHCWVEITSGLPARRIVQCQVCQLAVDKKNSGNISKSYSACQSLPENQVPCFVGFPCLN